VSDPLAHPDEAGASCERHPRANLDALLLLAAFGSRLSSYNHDVASKVQGLMMALDELDELISDRGVADLGRALETARGALRELTQLLAASRALTRPVLTSATLRDLLVRASERVGVKLRGALPDASLAVTVPLVTQAFALALDVAGGPGRSRSLELEAKVLADHVELSLPCAAPPTKGELLALVGFLLARDGGSLCCTADDRLLLRLPLGDGT
jgi:hypothetical protein